jgi:hypothetical protein
LPHAVITYNGPPLHGTVPHMLTDPYPFAPLLNVSVDGNARFLTVRVRIAPRLSQFWVAGRRWV